MIKKIGITLFFVLVITSFAQEKRRDNPPIYIAFLWHMHQPIYFPGETIVETQNAGHYSYSVFDIHNERTGPYTSWPKDAVQKGISANLGHLGAQVSFSGSLIENLNNLENYGNGNFQNWKSSWNYIKTQNTVLGNPRLDMVGFGFHHPLMGLIDYSDIRKQIQFHKQIMAANFNGNYSKGIFPPENAFAPHMIPALVDEGLEWVLVDNIHFERAAKNYPFNTGGNLYEPNKADILNPDPNDWLQLNGLWAPTKVSAKWSSQPHYVEYVDPETGSISKIIAVPADRYMGNEDGRGGFGALNYDNVMSQLESYNTDPNHPILIVLHHDGDNYGGGTDSYYGSNFQNFVNWLTSNSSRFVCTTIQDYLEMFPPDPNDIIHIENGSWSGADNGDPEFKKWLGDPGTDGYSPDRNSWGVITAGQNFIRMAQDIDPNNSNTITAEKFFLNGEASDYWYWDGSLDGIWDAHPTRAANLGIPYAQNVIDGKADNTPPSIFKPQREPYNPGGKEWTIAQPSNFTVWTYAYDVSGLQSVKLKYRTDNDGENDLNTNDNETYSGGADVTAWSEIEMTPKFISSKTNINPLFKADEYSAEIKDMDNVLVDYYVEAVDIYGNTEKSVISHVWVGDYNSGGGGTSGGITIDPENPTRDDQITITIENSSQGAKLHWGVNNSGSSWVTPNQVYWTNGTALFNGTGPAVESDFGEADTSGNISIKIGPFNKSEQSVDRVNFVIHYDDNTWDNNNGSDYLIDFGGGSGGGDDFVMDGKLDQNAMLLESTGSHDLYVGWKSPILYIATQSASSIGNDVFVFLSGAKNDMIAAPWAKAGQVSEWSAFLANESSNNYNTWTTQAGTAESEAGDFLEGTINVEEEFSTIPSSVFLSVGIYGTDDNGALTAQIPAGNSDGNIDPNELKEFDFIITDLKNEKVIPDKFELSQNYPNPFNPSTVIRYAIPSSNVHVNLNVYDILGNEIATLVNENKNAGNYEVTFSGVGLASGVYFYKLQTSSGFVSTKKLMLMK